MGVNKAILIGNLGKDPELKYTASGRAVTTFTLATTERWTNQEGQKQEQTIWHNIVAWGRPAEIMNEYLAKGRQVYIEGKIVNRSYDDKDGNKRYISEVVVQNFQFIGGGRDSGSSGGDRASVGEDSGAPEGAAPADDDLPF